MADEAKGGAKKLRFILDSNLGLDVKAEPWRSFLSEHGVECLASSDLPRIDAKIYAHEADIAFMPIGDFHRMTGKGDRYYRGFVIATSKFLGTTDLPSVWVVRKDDSASSWEDLEGSAYGYINKSCSSSYFPPAIVLNRKGKTLDKFLKIQPTKAWQGQIDAVVAKEVRSTMVPEDVWKTTPANAETTRIIGRYDQAKPALIVASHDLDETFSRKFFDLLVSWEPKWEAVYGAFTPYYYADVQHFFHDLNELPRGM